MTPQEQKELVMVCGAIAIVDPDIYDATKDKTWRLNKDGYPKWVSSRKGKTFEIKLHHFVNGKPPKGMHTDHINQNKLDNRKANLRFVTPSHNAINSKIRANGTSKYKGVFLKKGEGKWCATITVDYKKYYLGYYTNEDDAGRAYNTAAKKYYGDKATLNPIGE